MAKYYHLIIVVAMIEPYTGGAFFRIELVTDVGVLYPTWIDQLMC